MYADNKKKSAAARNCRVVAALYYKAKALVQTAYSTRALALFLET